MRICFVCLGNIVRSPLAEKILYNLAEERGVADNFEIESAGTSGWHIGDPPDKRMRDVAKKFGLVYGGKAKQFKFVDFQRFEMIIALDNSNKSSLRKLAPNQKDKDKIHLLREFDPIQGYDLDVPDPYYGGIQGFEDVYDIVERCCRSLLDSLIDKYHS